MKEVKIKGKVEMDRYLHDVEIDIEFGKTQAGMNFSKNGTIQRKLRLKHNDKVEVVIRKID